MLSKKLLAGAVVTCLVFICGAASADEKAGLALDATYAQRYIWRGIPVNEESVLQPSLDLSGGGFALNFWGNVDLTGWGDDQGGYGDESWNFTEIDYTGSYERQVGPASVSLGFVTYTFPNLSELGAVPATELFIGASFDVPASPSLAYYYDAGTTGKGGTEGAGYASLGISHSFELMENVGLDLSGSLGWANHKFLMVYYGINEQSDFHDWSAAAALPISLPSGFYVAPALVYTGLLENESRDVVDDADLDTEAGVFTLSLGFVSEV